MFGFSIGLCVGWVGLVGVWFGLDWSLDWGEVKSGSMRRSSKGRAETVK